MTTLHSRLDGIRERIARAAARSGRDLGAVTLVAVSKGVSMAQLQEAAGAGQVIFGENYLQEAVDKIAALPGMAWHFIGRIQSNKIRQIAELFQAVETVDRIKIVYDLEKQLASLDRIMPVYAQVNIGRESQKAGALPEHIDDLVVAIARCHHLRLAGLMAIPPYHPRPEASRGYFRELRELADDLLQRGVTPKLLGLSMGMSADFEIAIEEGATLVRVGSALFGERG